MKEIREINSFTLYKRTLALVLAVVMVFNLSSEVLAQAYTIKGVQQGHPYFNNPQYQGQGDKLAQDKKFQKRINDYSNKIISLLIYNSEKLAEKLKEFPKAMSSWQNDFSNQFTAKLGNILKDVKRPIKNSDEVVDAIFSKFCLGK